MKEKIENVWKRHKRKILMGALIGGTLVIIVRRRSLKKIKVPITTNELQWVFENLDDAIAKFRGLEIANTTLEMNKVVELTAKSGEYTVMFS